jgi:hypothetical protein
MVVEHMSHAETSAGSYFTRKHQPRGALSVSVRRLMTMRVMHCFAAKLFMVFHRTLSARRHRPMVALAIVEVMIDMSVEMFRPMEPWSGSDEYPA